MGGLVGFALGCALIQAAGGQSLDVVHPTEMAYTPQAAEALQSKAMRPTIASGAKGRREMMTGVFGFAAAAAADRKALAEGAAPATKKRDDRLKFLVAAPGLAIGWVGFNIVGPALTQLEVVQDRQADVAAGKNRRDAAVPRKGTKGPNGKDVTIGPRR